MHDPKRRPHDVDCSSAGRPKTIDTLGTADIALSPTTTSTVAPVTIYSFTIADNATPTIIAYTTAGGVVEMQATATGSDVYGGIDNGFVDYAFSGYRVGSRATGWDFSCLLEPRERGGCHLTEADGRTRVRR